MPRPAISRPPRPRLAATLLLPVLLALGLPAQAALFGSDDSIREFAPTRTGTLVPDHGAWDRFLSRYLVTDAPGGINLLPYGEVTAEDRRALRGYIDHLQGLDPLDASRDEQMAYWINLYNAVTVEVILANPGVDSIRDIRDGLFGAGPWDMHLVQVGGRSLSLNDIEHRILRPLFTDPRIHFAVNCASMGCPNLAPEAYTGARLEAMLDAGARAYVNHPRGVRFEGERLHLSSIFDWYRDDFPAGRAAFMAWLAAYTEPPLAARLRAYEGRISHDYDWALNAP
ncbi:MAG TPA: DUF547 domain-containing protein [Pseudomonadales bacterium]|nr:DUF547 domain-containing protein [Pseudomonadales bacterium]